MKRARITKRLPSKTQQTVTADNTAGTESPVDADDLLGEAGAKSDEGAGTSDDLVPPEESLADSEDDRGVSVRLSMMKQSCRWRSWALLLTRTQRNLPAPID